MDLEGLKRIVNGPLGFSLRGATYGALLGWLHDKSKEEKDKKNSYHGMSIGAILGALGGAGYGQFRSDRSHAFDVQELKRKIDALSEKKAEDAEKKAQVWGWYPPAHDPNDAISLHKNKSMQTNEQKDWEGYGSSSVLRDVAKGLHEAVPGIADIVGSVAGVLNGTGRGIGNWISDGPETFGDAFSKGYNDSTRFAKKYYSDPIRNAQMYYGGDKVKKELDEMNEFYRKRVLEAQGPAADSFGVRNKKYWDAVERMNAIKSVSKGAGTIAQILAQWPMAGAAFGRLFGAAGKAIPLSSEVAAASNASSKIAPALNAASKSIPSISRLSSDVTRILQAATGLPYVVAPSWGVLDAVSEAKSRRRKLDYVKDGLDGYAKSWARANKAFDRISEEQDPRKSEIMKAKARGIALAAERKARNNPAWGQFVRK